MKKYINYFLGSLLAISIANACSNNDDAEVADPNADKPSMFEVSVDPSDLSNAPTTIIAWTESIDPDGGEVTYDVYLADTNKPSSYKKIASDLTVNSFTVDGIKIDNIYSIYVVAKNSKGKETKGTYSYKGYNQVPTDFVVTPTSITATSVVLTWTEATDPDGKGAVTYSVYVNDVLVASDLTERTYELTPVVKGTDYKVMIQAKDKEGAVKNVFYIYETCPSDLAGTFTYVHTKPSCSSTASFTGTVTWTERKGVNGEYITTDATFGQSEYCYGDVEMTVPRIIEKCGKISVSGTDIYGSTYTYTIVSVSGKDLTIDWSAPKYRDSGRVVLTRTDGKDWPALTN